MRLSSNCSTVKDVSNRNGIYLHSKKIVVGSKVKLTDDILKKLYLPLSSDEVYIVNEITSINTLILIDEFGYVKTNISPAWVEVVRN